MKEEIYHTHCLRCGRALKNPEWQLKGMGKVCWDKTHKEEKTQPLFDISTLVTCKQTVNK